MWNYKLNLFSKITCNIFSSQIGVTHSLVIIGTRSKFYRFTQKVHNFTLREYLSYITNISK